MNKEKFRLYRFRSIKSLFEYKELEDEYIYFASREELNDPMEGFINFYWKGDTVVWENLLKHYIYCLAFLINTYEILGADFDFGKENFPIFVDDTKFQNMPFGDLLNEIVNAFFDDQDVKDLLEFIKVYDRKVKKDELLFYLSYINQIAFSYVTKVFSKRYGSFSIPKKESTGLFKKLIEQKNAFEIEQGVDKIKTFFDIVMPVIRKEIDFMRLSFKQEYEGKLNSTEFKAKNFFLLDFPAYYVDRLQELAFPNLYYSCFMSSYEDVANWGHYADSNKGCCLIFEPKFEYENPIMTFHSKIEKKSLTIVENFVKVNYSKKIPEIDFFSNLGNIRLPINSIDNCWYKNRNKEFSKTHRMPKSEQSLNRWRRQYNNLLLKMATTKLPAWKNEREYRIFLQDGLECCSDKASRKLCYDFNTLKGIAFGVNTSEADKLKVINLITEKCKNKNRTDFKFYQAEINIKTGKIELSDLNIPL